MWVPSVAGCRKGLPGGLGDRRRAGTPSVHGTVLTEVTRSLAACGRVQT